MAQTTMEEARRCPRCQEPGLASGTRPAPERWMGTFHIFKCDNNRCVRYESNWLVQVRPDGTIPEPTTEREKSYPIMEGLSTQERITKARARVDASINESLSR